jgi:hypothetical protein
MVHCQCLKTWTSSASTSDIGAVVHRAHARFRIGVASWLGALLACLPAAADTLRVPEDHPTIQAAIDAATDGDDVLVAPGVYTERIDLLGKAITVHSVDGADATTIDGGGAGTVVTCVNGEGRDTVLDGFTITGGAAEEGAGLLAVDAGPTVTACHFIANVAMWDGGGIRCERGDPVITDCRFTSNGSFNGAGLSFRHGNAVVERCVFRFNVTTGWYSAGLHAAGSGRIDITDCRFSDNLMEFHDSYGAGIAVGTDVATITGCTFERNRARHGGAVSAFTDVLTVTDCVFEDNVGVAGGAMDLDSGVVAVAGCTFRRNRHIGVLTGDVELTLADCRFEENVGGALTQFGHGYPYEVSSVVAERCVFERNTAWCGSAVDRVPFRNRMMLLDCTFIGNESVESGAICDTSDAYPLRLIRCTFIGNHATRDEGGAVTSLGPGIEVEDCVFRANSAADTGGAVFTWQGSSTITRCTFEDNVATAGGGVFGYSPTTVVVSDSTFCGNVPDDADGDWTDGGGNVFCCPGDVDGSGAVDAGDLVLLLAAWGACQGCAEDVTGDGVVDTADLVTLLGAWGDCS